MTVRHDPASLNNGTALSSGSPAMVDGFFLKKNAAVGMLLWMESAKTYILKLHRQSPDEVVCPGLLGFLENRKWENIYTIPD